MFNNYPKIELEKIRDPKQPELEFELVDKETNKVEYVKHKDIVNSLMKMKLPKVVI